MLGDSITQGIGTPLGKTFSDILEYNLNKAAAEQSQNNKYEVMNFGVMGYNLEAEIEILKTKTIQYAPDIVIVNYYYNDGDPIPGYHMFVLAPDAQLSKTQRLAIIRKYYNCNNPTTAFIKRSLLNHSELYLFLYDRLNGLWLDKIDIETIFKKHYGEIMGRRETQAVAKLLKELKGLGEKYHFNILVCIHSFLLQGEHPNNALFAELVQKTDLSYFRMYTYYRNRYPGNNDNSLIGLDHCHPNELGHRIIAEAMFQELKDKRLIKLR